MGFTMVGEVVGYPNEMVDFSPICQKLTLLRRRDIAGKGTPVHFSRILKGLREIGDNTPYTAGTQCTGCHCHGRRECNHQYLL
jgi:hypothetical protein